MTGYTKEKSEKIIKDAEKRIEKLEQEKKDYGTFNTKQHDEEIKKEKNRIEGQKALQKSFGD